MYYGYVPTTLQHGWDGLARACGRTAHNPRALRGGAADAEVVREALCDAQRCVEQRRVVKPGHRVVRERLPPVVATTLIAIIGILIAIIGTLISIIGTLIAIIGATCCCDIAYDAAGMRCAASAVPNVSALDRVSERRNLARVGAS